MNGGNDALSMTMEPRGGLEQTDARDAEARAMELDLQQTRQLAGWLRLAADSSPLGNRLLWLVSCLGL